VIPLGDSRRLRRTPWATWALAALCLAAFGWQLTLGERLPAEIARVAAAPREIAALHDPLTLALRLVAAMFLHAGWLHLLGNLAFLLVFADDVESALPRRRFLLLYLLSGLFAALAQTAATPRSPAPMIGASGAISGVLGAFLVLYPAREAFGRATRGLPASAPVDSRLALSAGVVRSAARERARRSRGERARRRRLVRPSRRLRRRSAAALPPPSAAGQGQATTTLLTLTNSSRP
jgi:membrane associated rhomboid family serine protease